MIKRALIVGAALGAAISLQPAAAQDDAASGKQDLERLRADFRARFVDYDARLDALARRIAVLEERVGQAAGEDAEGRAAEPLGGANAEQHNRTAQ